MDEEAGAAIAAAGAGSSATAPITNCAPCGASHCIWQDVAGRGSDRAWRGHWPGGCDPAGQQSSCGAAAACGVDGQQDDSGAANTSAVWHTTSATAHAANRRLNNRIRGPYPFWQIYDARKPLRGP
jgi:hypothetical protein